MAWRGAADWLERRQVPLYLAAIAAGAAVGWMWPSSAGGFEVAITPALAALLYATFLAVPFARIRDGFRDARFLGTLAALNFVAVPAVVFALTRFVADDRALLVGALVVLLAPCVDYVIVFTRLAGGDWARLLAVTPVLMALQLVLLPLYLWWFAGAEAVAAIDPAPFAEAFVLLIALPLAASVATRWGERRVAAVGVFTRAVEGLMVPLMVVTLVSVVASQFATVAAHAGALLRVVPLYAAFLAIMPVLGAVAGRWARLDAPRRRALAFSGSTRNSLVVLPLVFALPDALAAPAVVTQTLVELVGMVVLVRVIPRAILDPGLG